MKKIILPALLVLGSLVMTETAVAQTQIYKKWSLRVNAQDSAAVRQPSNMAGSSVTLRKFVLANGSAATPPAPFSSKYGMAFAPVSAGINWGTAAGGTGSTLRRYYSVQLTATAPAGVTLRADTLMMNLAFLNTVSGTNVGVVYSKNGFSSPADSTEISGGAILPTGRVTTGAANATTFFNTFPVTPSVSLVAGVPNTPLYALALNGANGVTITGGQTLTIRIYVCCSSGNAIGGANTDRRDAILRDVVLKSRQARGSLATRSLVSTSLEVYPNPTQNQVVVPHAAIGQDARVAVYNTVGAQVASVVAKAGTSQTVVNLAGLASGLYMVEYTNGQERSSARVVKE